MAWICLLQPWQFQASNSCKVSLLVGWSMSKAAMTQLPADTHWHVFLPEDWHQVRWSVSHLIGSVEGAFTNTNWAILG